MTLAARVVAVPAVVAAVWLAAPVATPGHPARPYVALAAFAVGTATVIKENRT